MKKCLIVDDSDYKRKDISAVLREMIPEVEIFEAASYKSGIRQLCSRVYDFVVMDISMPTFDYNGGTWLNFGGRDIMVEMVRREFLYPVIVVSQFYEFGREGESVSLDTLSSELHSQFQPFYRGAISYSALDNKWQIGLRKFITKTAKL